MDGAITATHPVITEVIANTGLSWPKAVGGVTLIYYQNGALDCQLLLGLLKLKMERMKNECINQENMRDTGRG